ncbi:MAG TPA: helix-turn-helix transcriptional regulator [Clostridiales bacterium]|jgi:transcriptional regulator with XRE-family HTH domain|nr:helix-turn-helix transcriptional regulator [Clostridiales bacterium]
MQKTVAADLGIGLSTFSQYETGKREPDHATLLKIANYFNVTTDYLLGNSDDPNPAEKEKPAANDGHRLSVEERVEQILAGISDENGGTLMLDGKPASPEALEALRQAIRMGVEYARKINREKNDKEKK